MFTEVHLFASYRVAGHASWTRSRKGKIERIFLYSGGSDGVEWNVGAQTLDEKNYPVSLGYAALVP